MCGLDKETEDAHVFTGRDGQGWRQRGFGHVQWRDTELLVTLTENSRKKTTGYND